LNNQKSALALCIQTNIDSRLVVTHISLVTLVNAVGSQNSNRPKFEIYLLELYGILIQFNYTDLTHRHTHLQLNVMHIFQSN